jgi:uncharacterized protein with PIN domain
MAVPCPTCGRTYDIALFQFGRTIDCTCGTRVAHEARVATPPGEPRLFADAMLGRLARWLRIIGYDTEYDPHIADETLVRRCWREGRILLTCDQRLAGEWTIPRALVLRSGDALTQLREVVDRLALDRDRPLFSRCPLCNALVQPVERTAVQDEVPERVWREQERFVRCPRCRRVYWEGSHTRRMRERLARTLDEEGPAPPG